MKESPAFIRAQIAYDNMTPDEGFEIEEWECESCGEDTEWFKEGFMCINEDCDIFGNLITHEEALQTLSDKMEAAKDDYDNYKCDSARDGD